MIPRPSRRRVVMVCDDTTIDRRIIREALTLAEQGWDPVVVSLNAGKEERAYWEEGVPVLHIREDSSMALVVYYLGEESSATAPPLAGGALGRGIWSAAVRAGRWTKRRGLVPNGWRRRHLKRLLTLLAAPALLLAAPFWLAARRRRARGLALSDRAERVRDAVRFNVAEAAAANVMYYEPDLIIAHDLPMLGAGALAAHLLRVPLIYDSHELYTEIHTLSPESARRFKEIEAELITLPGAVFTVNEFIARELAERYGIPEPGVLYNCTTLPPDWNPPYDRLRTQLGLAPETKVVLFHGWLALGRNLEHLVDAFGLLPEEYVLVLLGFGDYAAELARRAAEAGCRDRVFVLDAVPQTEVLSYVASADLGVIPYAPIDRNSYFCSPNKLFDFLLCQVPVLGYDSPFLTQTLSGQGVGANLKLDSPEAFRDGILAVLEDDVRYAATKARLAEVGPRYDWRLEGEKLLQVVARLMSRAAAAR
jgi:glycosyltransferase involved in cell wall biosynthesis